jgi:hypothetical protein
MPAFAGMTAWHHQGRDGEFRDGENWRHDFRSVD